MHRSGTGTRSSRSRCRFGHELDVVQCVNLMHVLPRGIGSDSYFAPSEPHGAGLDARPRTADARIQRTLQSPIARAQTSARFAAAGCERGERAACARSSRSMPDLADQGRTSLAFPVGAGLGGGADQRGRRSRAESAHALRLVRRRRCVPPYRAGFAGTSLRRRVEATIFEPAWKQVNFVIAFIRSGFAATHH